MLSGGSTESTSLIPVAITFTEQTVPSGRLLVGSSVAVEVPVPLTVKPSGVPLGHWSVNELVVKFTFSLKLTVMLLLGLTPVVPFAGVVVVTAGALSVVKEKL